MTIGGDRPSPAAVAGLRAVPDVSGLSIRDAASRLHSAGFRGRYVRRGTDVATVPSAGAMARPGTVVRLQYGGS
jgi:beta-lactam-binding protein with PASTA domain